MKPERTTAILLVEPKRELASTLDGLFSSEYEIRTAYSSQEAIELLSDSVMVTLIDNGLSTTVIETIVDEIQQERHHSRILTIIGESQSERRVRLSDGEIQKPVSPTELVETIERLVDHAQYEREIDEWLRLLSRKASMENEKDQHELSGCLEYQELKTEIDELRAKADSSRDEILNDRDETLFREIRIDTP